MDFTNERYVRLYTRETTTWRLLTWEGQALLPQVLRIVDRAGVLDLGGVAAHVAVASHLPSWPTDAVERGLHSLVERGVVVIADDTLVWPKYLDAQECQLSDAQRKREERERRRNSASVTRGHAVSQVVTPSQAKPSQAETNNLGHSTQTPPEVSQVLLAMREAMRDLTPGAKGPQDTPTNRRLIRRPMRDCNATVGDWQTVIRRQFASVRSDRSKWKYLSFSTLGRPQNFERILNDPSYDVVQHVNPERTGL